MPVDVAIIGAGPAGMSCALQLKRSGVDFLLFEKDKPGGLLQNANLVENYPGFPQGISGPELVTLFVEHLGSLGIRVFEEEVKRLGYQDEVFSIETIKGMEHSRFLVLATGTSPKEFTDIEIPDDCRDRVYHEVSHIQNISRKKITIIGAGDAAYDFALNLAENNDVLILNRGKETKCLKQLLDRAKENPSIEYRDRTTVKDVCLTDDTLRLEIETSGTPGSLNTDYLLFATGREVRFDFLDDKIFDRIPELEGEGLLYKIGDINHGMYRQVGISVGDGILAAMKICEKLEVLNR